MNIKSKVRHLGVMIALLSALPASSAMAGPGHGGGIGGPDLLLGAAVGAVAAVAVTSHAGPPGPGHVVRWAPGGPGHGHGLPGAARGVWIGSTLYYLAADTYYLWDGNQQLYLPVQAPPATLYAPAVDVVAYPAKGQSEDQRARDRYECHRWANQESGAAANSAAPPVTANNADTYRRALSACLGGRGYSVQ